MQKTMQNKISARVTYGQQVIIMCYTVLQNYSNTGDFRVTSSYILVKDSTYALGDDDDLLGAVSLLSMNNDYSAAASQASYYRPIASGWSQASRDNMMSPTKRSKKDFHGSTSMNL
eukprot:11380761-Ditylum_brightwellii.AAC.1